MDFSFNLSGMNVLDAIFRSLRQAWILPVSHLTHHLYSIYCLHFEKTG
jgi:hypothetical protein